MFVCLSVDSHIGKATGPSFTVLFQYIMPVAAAQTSVDGSAIHYVFPVLSIFFYFDIIEQMGQNQR